MTVKISNLPAATSLGDGDLIPIVQGGTTKKLDFVGDAVTQSATDTTAGRLLKVGDFGVTGDAILSATTDFNQYTISGFYLTPSSGLTNSPDNIQDRFYLMNQNRSALSVQLAFRRNSDQVFWRSTTGAPGGTWQELYHTGNIGNIDVASGDFSVDVSGSPDLFIQDGTGDVAIGTTFPVAKVTVQDIRQFNPLDASATAHMLLQQASGTAGDGNYGSAITFTQINSGRPWASICGVQDGADSDKGGLSIFTKPGTTSTNIVAEAVRIDGDGNVGIDVTNPARKLHVKDVMRLEPRATAPSSPAKGDIYFDSSDDKLKCYDGSTWQNLY